MLLTSICKYDVVCVRAPFCSLDETKCHLMGTVKALAICWDVPLAFQLDFICYFCLNLYLRTYLHMLAMNALV